MTKEELIEKLKTLNGRPEYDIEQDHKDADQLLLEYINDKEITEAFNSVEKWYS